MSVVWSGSEFHNDTRETLAEFAAAEKMLDPLTSPFNTSEQVCTYLFVAIDNLGLLLRYLSKTKELPMLAFYSMSLRMSLQNFKSFRSLGAAFSSADFGTEIDTTIRSLHNSLRGQQPLSVNHNSKGSIMNERDRIDPQSREPLEGLLSFMPGGFNGIPDIGARREAVAGLLAAMGADQPVNPNVTHEDHFAPGHNGAPDVRVRIYTPTNAQGKLPGLVYIHGGGMILGSIEGEEANCIAMCEKLGIVVASVDYRKSPENPYPAAPDDCYAGASWVFANAAALGIDSSNIGIYGGSAGGGLAIAAALMARDRSGPKFRYMMPIYPMIDDRNVTHSSHEVTEVGIWDRAGNLEAWECYLGGKPADQYAAPTRATDLTHLPPAFIDVGQVDMFRDEDFDFAMRLNQAGVPCEFRVNPGAFHASETFAPEAELSKRIWAGRYEALRRFIDA